MTIYTTSKEKPTVETNSTSGCAINDLDFATGKRKNNAFAKLREAFALQGHALHRSDPADGPVSYWVERWGLFRYMPDLDAVEHFLRRIGGRP